MFDCQVPAGMAPAAPLCHPAGRCWSLVAFFSLETCTFSSFCSQFRACIQTPLFLSFLFKNGQLSFASFYFVSNLTRFCPASCHSGSSGYLSDNWEIWLVLPEGALASAFVLIRCSSEPGIAFFSLDSCSAWSQHMVESERQGRVPGV